MNTRTVHKIHQSQRGFTLIELIIVIIILGVLAAVAAPRFLDLSTDAKLAALDNIKGQIRTTIDLVKVKARIAGLRPTATNPGGIQTDYIVEFGFGATEVDFRNLCPESEGEGGDQLTMLDFLQLSEELTSRTTNQHTLIGYDVPSSGTPTDQGCYVLYDSFGTPDCTVTIVSADC